MDKKALKILYAASTDAHLRSFHLPYLAALRDMGHHVVAAGRGDGHGLPEGVEFVSVPFTKSMTSPRNLAAVTGLCALLKRERFDLILTHTSLAAFFVRLAVLLTGKRPRRLVNVVHGYLFDGETPFPRRALLLWAEKLTAPVTDAILTMNAADAYIARKYRLTRGELRPIRGMGVELSRYAPPSSEERAAARDALGIAQNAFVLLCAAEFSERKHQRMLIEAMPLLPKEVMLLLPGDGALLPACRALAETLGVTDRVRFPGFAENMLPYLHASDLCVSACRSEGLPFHVMESMACGLPAVLSDVKGHRDLVPDGRTGLLYPFDDIPAFVSAVSRLRDDETLRRTAGGAATELVRQCALSDVLPENLHLFLGDAEKGAQS